jgi:hypothetical protein
MFLLDSVFPWIQQALERSLIPLSANQIRQLQRALQDLAASPNQTGIDATNLLDQLRRHIAKLPNH